MTTDTRAQLRLMAWLSPVFPVGSFSYSNGLERAVHDGLVTDTASLETWLSALVTYGSAWNDAVLCAEAWHRAAKGDLAELAELAEALASSRERHIETMLQGAAFMDAAKKWPNPIFEHLPDNCPYPVAVGAVASAHAVPLEAALAAFLQSFSINLLQAAIRLSVTGQTGVTSVLAAMEPIFAETARRAARSDLNDLGSASFMADISAMKHETQHSRLFRS